jgi:hypothetical protein
MSKYTHLEANKLNNTHNNSLKKVYNYYVTEKNRDDFDSV